MANPDLDAAKAAAALADGGDALPADAPCCAWCGGIKMDCTRQPVPPAELLRSRVGCPMSIVAYQIRAAHQKGSAVQVIPQPGGTPFLRVDGKIVDPLEHYGRESCGCAG